MNLNFKIIFYFLGFLLLINGAFMFLSALLSFLYSDGITVQLTASGFIVSLVGLVLLFLNRKHDKLINKREGYLVVVLGWLLMDWLSVPFGSFSFLRSSCMLYYGMVVTRFLRRY